MTGVSSGELGERDKGFSIWELWGFKKKKTEKGRYYVPPAQLEGGEGLWVHLCTPGENEAPEGDQEPESRGQWDGVASASSPGDPPDSAHLS